MRHKQTLISLVLNYESFAEIIEKRPDLARHIDAIIRDNSCECWEEREVVPYGASNQ